MDETTIVKIEDWIEKRAKEALCLARKRGLTHADAVEVVTKHLTAEQKLKIINKALELFLREKVEQGKALVDKKRRMS